MHSNKNNKNVAGVRCRYCFAHLLEKIDDPKRDEICLVVNEQHPTKYKETMLGCYCNDECYYAFHGVSRCEFCDMTLDKRCLVANNLSFCDQDCYDDFQLR